jgi:lysophospholipase L1-like esterase
MSTEGLNDLIKQAEALSPEEQLRLVAHLVEKVRAAYPLSRPHRKWAEICGTAPYPLLGEDAQAWVSRTRREDTEQRERQLKRQP